jgi:glycosyltransferase involved in cell wall biosynthesis
MKTVLVVPSYNEGKRVEETIEKILETRGDKIIIIVDDGSIDDTTVKLQKRYENNRRIVVLRHVLNLGKGAAMKTGVEYALGLGAEKIIFVDADGQHNPRHIGDFEKRLNRADMVFGFREFSEGTPWIRKIGNVMAINIVKVIFGIKRKDLLCGFFGLRAEVYQKIKWSSCRYGVETEIATKVAKSRIGFSEIKVDNIYIDKYKGVTIMDAFKILFNIPVWYLSK